MDIEIEHVKKLENIIALAVSWLPKSTAKKFIKLVELKYGIDINEFITQTDK